MNITISIDILTVVYVGGAVILCMLVYYSLFYERTNTPPE